MTSEETSEIGYRPDVDGLRAVAIISVVVFHYFPHLLTGGFTGVDIFFVISGFLISSILYKEIELGTFKFLRFYGRRIRRIFPALILVLMVTYLFYSHFLLSSDLRQLGKHILGAAAFCANFVYWRESGYFDAAATMKPLLHIWSLGIEEQFYFVWPILLLLLYKYTKPQWMISLLLISSFGYGLYCVRTDLTTAFYSPFSRFWELMVGGLLAFVLRQRPTTERNPNHVLSILGAFFMLIGLLIIDKDRAFPGWLALLPTMGAMLIILAGQMAVINRFLSTRMMVGIGLISYPLYLWHWPALVGYKIVFGQQPTGMAAVGLIFMCVTLSYLTWRFLEIPIRTKWPKGISTWTLITLMGLMAVLGYINKTRHISMIDDSATKKGMDMLLSR